MDKLIKAMALGKNVRAYAAVTTETVNKAAKIHNTSAVASAALGRSLTAAALMGAMAKEDTETVSLQFKGGGPLGTLFAVSDAFANVRGYVGDPSVELPLNKKGKLDVGGAVGRQGTLCVIRDDGVTGKPYIGQVRIATGEIGDDINFYYASSEQVPTASGLGVLVDTDYSIKAAGGFIIQLLPGADDSVIDAVENGLKKITSVTDLICEGKSPQQILEDIFGDIEIIGEETPDYVCNCSEERFEKGILSLGSEEIEGIIRDQVDAEIYCNFCNKRYLIKKQRLEELLKTARQKENGRQ